VWFFWWVLLLPTVHKIPFTANSESFFYIVLMFAGKAYIVRLLLLFSSGPKIF
jgi:uncharacterized protein YhhL (DUF1145 family)